MRTNIKHFPQLKIKGKSDTEKFKRDGDMVWPELTPSMMTHRWKGYPSPGLPRERWFWSIHWASLSGGLVLERWEPEDWKIKAYLLKGKCSILLDLSSQAVATKTKINKWTYIKLKSFCRVEKTINNVMWQPTELKMIFANYLLDKG